MILIRNFALAFVMFTLSLSLHASDKHGSYDKYLEHIKAILSTDPDVEIQKPFLFLAEDPSGHQTYILGTTWPSEDALDYVPPAILDIVQKSDILLHDDSGNLAAITKASVENQLNTAEHLTPDQLAEQLSPTARKSWEKLSEEIKTENPMAAFMLEMDIPQPVSSYLGIALSTPITRATTKNPSYVEAKMKRRMKLLSETLSNTPNQLMIDSADEALDRVTAFTNGDKSAFDGMFSHRTAHQIIVDHALKHKLRVQELDSQVERQNNFRLVNSIEAFEDLLIHCTQTIEEYDLTWGDMAGHDFEIMTEMQEYLFKQAPYMMSQLIENSASRWIKTFLSLNAQKKSVVVAVDKRILATQKGLIAQLRKQGFKVEQVFLNN